MAETANFDDAPIGSAPKGWTITMTGKGDPPMDSRERRYGTVASQRAEAIRQGHVSACPQGWDEHQEWIYRGEVQGDLGLGRPGCGPRLARQ